MRTRPGQGRGNLPPTRGSASGRSGMLLILNRETHNGIAVKSVASLAAACAEAQCKMGMEA
jgi:hypothetical protein